jgi:hypothetical protein
MANALVISRGLNGKMSNDMYDEDRHLILCEHVPGYVPSPPQVCPTPT